MEVPTSSSASSHMSFPHWLHPKKHQLMPVSRTHGTSQMGPKAPQCHRGAAPRSHDLLWDFEPPAALPQGLQIFQQLNFKQSFQKEYMISSFKTLADMVLSPIIPGLNSAHITSAYGIWIATEIIPSNQLMKRTIWASSKTGLIFPMVKKNNVRLQDALYIQALIEVSIRKPQHLEE